MGFKVLEKLAVTHFQAVTFPAIVINTGRINSSLNSAFIKELGHKPGDTLKFDIMHDAEKRRFAIRINPKSGTWEKLVTKSSLVDLWLTNFFSGHEIFLKGQVPKGSKGVGIRVVCPLKQSTKHTDLWIFTIPDEFYADGPPAPLAPTKTKPKVGDERTTQTK